MRKKQRQAESQARLKDMEQTLEPTERVFEQESYDAAVARMTENLIAKSRTYPPFDEEATCKKCGHPVVLSEFQARQSIVDSGRFYNPPYTYRGYGVIYPQEELIRRKCTRCHHTWNECPLELSEQ